MKSEVLGAFRNTVAIFALDFCFFVDYLEVDGWPTEFIDSGLFTTFVNTFSLIGQTLTNALKAIECMALDANPLLKVV